MKTAVILFNLGGPDSPEAVRPFLFNLFKDKAIIQLPWLFRLFLAKLISSRRAPFTREIYQKIGNRSPLLEWTNSQALTLEQALSNEGDYQVFVSMRYWHPFAYETVKEVKDYAPDKIILLPLYPQYSTTTTASSFKEWDKSAKRIGLDVPTARICCYPTQADFLAAHAKLIQEAYWQASETSKPRILFSAHGLPERIIKKGDPYQWQVEETVKKLTNILSLPQLDYVICYQSRVGRLKWIGPSTEEEIKRAGMDGMPLVVVPVAFVSEHSETLVELDIEYQQLAEEHGVAAYIRVPALGIEPFFIDALANICITASKHSGCMSSAGMRICPDTFTQCPCKV